jgi:hypothetical protein
VEEIAKAKSNDSVSAATEAAKIINNPKLCQPVWASVKRELLRYSKEAERMQRLGVQHTYLPPRYSDKPLEPALSEVKDAIASITPGRQKLSEKSEMTPPPEAKSLEKSEATPPPEAKSLEKSEATPPPEAKSLEKSEMTPTPVVKNREKKSNRSSSLTPLAESLKNLNAILGEEEKRTLPDPWDFNPLEVIELQERKAEEALDKARNEAQRQLRASQMKEVLEQIKATLPTNPQQRQSQLQIWTNGRHPYPAIAKRLIEANQNWGLYLDGKRVLEEEF